LKAILKKSAAKGLSLGEAPVPKIGPNEVLIRVRAAGICGTDAHIYDWNAWAQERIKPPLVVGHEFAGEIVELGSQVRGYAKGETVSAEGHITCGHCVLCKTGQAHICRDVSIIGVDRDGCFAEFIAMPASNLWKIPPEVPIEWAAIHDPLGNAFHTVLTAEIPGRKVMILGAGPIGLMAIGIARASGAARVIATETNPFRRELAMKMGAHQVLDPSKDDVAKAVADATDGLGVDVACVMSGHPDAIRQALRSVRNGGRVQLLGLPSKEVSIDLSNDVIFKGITIYGVIGRRMYDTWQQMSESLRAGLIDLAPVITHRIPFEQFEKGFAAMAQGDTGKVILLMESR
jgi:threonine 3-dehydrogenase